MATLAAKKEAVLPRIPTQEFAERVSKIQAKMRSQQIDLLVAYSNALDPGHVRYFCDVVGINEAAAIVIRLEAMQLFAQDRPVRHGPLINRGWPMSVSFRRSARLPHLNT